MNGPFLRTDTQTDVVVSLDELHHQLQRVESNPQCWKWAVLALMNATNGALVNNLTGTSNMGAFTEKSRKKWLEILQETELSRTAQDVNGIYLENPKRLLEIASGSKRFDSGAGPALTVTVEQEESFSYLLELRNGFNHFQPSHWAISLPDLPSVCADVLEIVRLASDDGHSLRHLPDTTADCLSEFFEKITLKLNALSDYYLIKE